MRSKMTSCKRGLAKTAGIAWILVALVCLVFAAAAFGQNKGKGGGKGGGGGGKAPLAGTIYFHFGDDLAKMDPDGGNKTVLPVDFRSEPSRDLHGGQRWFLQLRKIVGESYPSGLPRRELFAVREDGNEAFTVQLTFQSDLEPLPTFRPGFVNWGIGDVEISWTARLWDLDAQTVLEGGIYSARIGFDGFGNVTGLAAQPAAPLVDGALVEQQNGLLRPEIVSHDWSPDGNQIVYGYYHVVDDRRLGIADVVGGVTTNIPTEDRAFVPVWSPDGSKIAFARSAGLSQIATINPDGTGEKVIVRRTPSTSAGTPRWSPTGEHLLYGFLEDNTDLFNSRFDVYRVTSKGKGKTNLTADLDTSNFHARPAAWR